MSNRKNTDEIRVRGIRSGGYGQLPKIVMLDPNIPISAKGIYAFFASFTGGGNNKAFPTVGTILHNLNVTNNTYYKHFNVLLTLGLISVEQKNGGETGKGFKRNVYTIEDYPEAYIESLKSSAAEHLLSEVVSAEDLSGGGYGNIPKLVMLDNRVSVEAKALYAYICVFSGNSFSAMPSKKTAMYHLNISSNSYAKYGRELEEFGYVARKRIQKDGKFVGVRFVLAKSVKTTADETDPHTKISDTMDSPCTKISDTIDSNTKISDTIVSRTINSEANNISSKTKTEFNTNCVNHSFSRTRTGARTRVTAVEGDRVSESVNYSAVLQEMAEYGGLPYEYCFNRLKLEAAIEILTGANEERKNKDIAEIQKYNVFAAALTDMLDADMPDTEIKGGKLSYAKIYDRFKPAVEADYDEYGEPYAIAFNLYANVRQRYEIERTKHEIFSPQNYMKALIWTELNSAELEIQDKLAYDFGGKA